MSARALTEARLWYWQRVSAMALGVFVLVHLGIIFYAVRGGLTAAEILGRTQGSWGFAVFYGLFVLSAAVHAPIGLARIAEEWLGWRGRKVDLFMMLFGLLLLVTGLRAVFAVVAP